MILKRAVVLMSVAMFLAAPAFAQKIEVSGLFGWTFSDGVEGDKYAVGGQLFDTIDLKDSASWGLALGINATDNIEVGFLFGQQLSSLAIDGTASVELGDIHVNTYHPYVAFNAGAPDARVRPYFMVGLGATQFSGLEYTGLNGVRASTDSETQFSTTWGAGVKVFGGSNVGFRAGILWTPTYIKSDSEGWWCDPYWGCYVVDKPKYANQFQFNGGVTLRF